jgi:hypothetical protein
VGCRTVLAKRQLVRLVRDAAGAVRVDPSGKTAGRGAYLHERRACWEQALASGALAHALKLELSAAAQAELRALGAHYSNDQD